MDARRETNNIFKQLERFQNTIGEGIIWFRFDTSTSVYDDVYDEGGRTYLPGLAVPVLWIDQIEDTETYSAEGRRPTQRFRSAVSAKAMAEAGIGGTEAHGGRLWDTKPDGKPWWDDRSNDVIYYDGRFYEISNFQIRGRVRSGGDVIIGISGIETQHIDERVWDLFPANIGVT